MAPDHRWRMPRLRRSAAPGALVLILTLCGPAAGAGHEAAGPGGSEAPESLGTAFLISGPAATGDDSSPAVAANSSTGDLLIVWSDARNPDAHGTDIYGQRLSPEGDRIGPNFRISISPANQGNPSVAYNAAANEYLVVWQDDRNIDARGVDVYGQRISAAGTRVGPNFRVVGPRLLNHDTGPQLVYNATSDEYLVVWRDRDPGVEWRVRGQRLSPDGTRRGFTFTITGWLGQPVGEPAVAWNSTANTYLVVWNDFRLDTPRGHIFGQRLSARGKRLGGNLRISGSPALAYQEPAVAYNSSANQFLVVWSDLRNESHVWPQRGSEIYGQRLSSSGTWLGFNANITGPVEALHFGFWVGARIPDVAYDAGANRYLVAWHDLRHTNADGTASGTQVYGQPVSALGVRLGPNLRLNSPVGVESDFSDQPALAYDPVSGEHLVVWELHPAEYVDCASIAPEHADACTDAAGPRADGGVDIYGHRWTL